MMFICSKITRYEVLFIVALGLFTHVSCQFPNFIVREIGSSINFTCPDDLTNNHTYKFSALKKQATPELITPGARIKLLGPILMIVDLEWDDNGQYFCSIYNSNGNQIGNTKSLAILSLKTVTKYSFEIKPAVQSSVVDEGTSFEFRCEYGKGSTQMKWLRLRKINGTRNEDYIPRNLITVRTDSSKSVEVYSIKKVTPEDSGTYRCEITEKSGKRATRARVLQVKREKPPVFGDMKAIFVVNKGDDVQIVLHVTGSPSPNISCYHKDRLIIFCSGKTIDSVDISQNITTACSKDNYDLTGYHELMIRFATFAGNDGMYRCEASNSVGNDTINFRVNVTVSPKISRENSKYFAQRKTLDQKIKCIINLSNPRPTVTWSQQDLPTSSPEADPDEDKWTVSKYESELVPTHRGGYDSILTIPWEQEKSSFYRCFAGNNYGNDSRVFKFIRYGQGKEPIVVTPKSAVKNEGKTFIANCRVIVVFGGNIVFYRDNRTVMTNDNRTNITMTQDKDFRNITMVIRNLTLNDSGTYRCSEKGVSTNDYSQFVTLTVKALRPPVILDLQNQTADQDKVEETVLFCNVTGNPYPKVIWLRNSKPVEAKEIKSLNCGDQKSGYYYKNKEHTELAICEPEISHSGFYTCVVENQIGSIRRNMYLNVVAEPMFTEPTSLENKVLGAGDSLNHHCVVKGNPTPWVQWIMRNENKTMTNKSKEESILKINKMDESYVGNYTCRAWNSIGSIESHFLELKLKPPPEKYSPPLPSGDSMGAGSIVGIVIGVTIFLVVVFIIIFLWYRRQQKKLLFYKHQYFLRTGEYSVDPSLTLNEQSMNLPYDSDWEFPFERLVLGERLGAGAFGEVYKAEAMGILGLNPRDKSSIANKRRSKIRRSLRASQRPKKKTIPCDLSNAVVAVKSVKGQATENEIRDLAAELKLMIHIGEHKNIVNLLGACTTGRKLYVILEFCPYGNLLMFLRSKRDMYNSTWVKEIYDPDKEFTLIDIVGAAFQIAKGMDFLASRKLIHRDLAARNILVADEYVMKISDFGLARDIYQNDVYVKTSSGMLPVKWMAVESLFDRVYTHQSDVWSFGVLLWEMMTLGGTPYPDLPAEQLLDFLNEGKRMTQPNKCPLEVYTIMRDCWQEEPEARPTFATLVEHLGRILERHMEKANPYLHVEASPEEIEAAKEKDELVKPKSDYYLQPLLMSTKLHGYDSNAPLPTPPTDSYTQAVAPIPEADTIPTMKGAGSYALLREENPDEPKVPLDDESGIGLEDTNNKNHKDTNNIHGKSKSMESVV